MAKRYHSELINETSGHCNLPENVIMKEIGKTKMGGREIEKDLYSFVESDSKKMGSEFDRLNKPSKI